jgi:hypothetical protein
LKLVILLRFLTASYNYGIQCDWVVMSGEEVRLLRVMIMALSQHSPGENVKTIGEKTESQETEISPRFEPDTSTLQV